MKSEISEIATKNHETLWPGYKSDVMTTDPDLTKVFDNFAFDEILQNSNIDPKTRTLIIMASTIGSYSLSEYKIMLNATLNTGSTL